LVFLLAVSVVTAFATTTDELELIVGSGSTAVTAVVTASGGCSGIPGTVDGCSDLTIVVASPSLIDVQSAPSTTPPPPFAPFGGWTISSEEGSSYSPLLAPYGIDIGSLQATCEPGGPCTTNPLEVLYSATSFGVYEPQNAFVTSYTGNVVGGTGTTTTETAWFDNNNNLFAETNEIGSVTLTPTISSGSAIGGSVAAVPPYSLTLDDVFTSPGTGSSYSIDGDIIAPVPEPAALVLFGTVVAFCASRLRRHLRS